MFSVDECGQQRRRTGKIQSIALPANGNGSGGGGATLQDIKAGGFLWKQAARKEENGLWRGRAAPTDVYRK